MHVQKTSKIAPAQPFKTIAVPRSPPFTRSTPRNYIISSSPTPLHRTPPPVLHPPTHSRPQHPLPPEPHTQQQHTRRDAALTTTTQRVHYDSYTMPRIDALSSHPLDDVASLCSLDGDADEGLLVQLGAGACDAAARVTTRGGRSHTTKSAGDSAAAAALPLPPPNRPVKWATKLVRGLQGLHAAR